MHDIAWCYTHSSLLSFVMLKEEETPEATPSPETHLTSSRPSQTPTPTPEPSTSKQKKGGDKAAAAVEASNQVSVGHHF